MVTKRWLPANWEQEACVILVQSQLAGRCPSWCRPRRRGKGRFQHFLFLSVSPPVQSEYQASEGFCLVSLVFIPSIHLTLTVLAYPVDKSPELVTQRGALRVLGEKSGVGELSALEVIRSAWQSVYVRHLDYKKKKQLFGLTQHMQITSPGMGLPPPRQVKSTHPGSKDAGFTRPNTPWLNHSAT